MYRIAIASIIIATGCTPYIEPSYEPTIATTYAINTLEFYPEFNEEYANDMPREIVVNGWVRD